ncbi:MAG: hypothetical protein ABSA81_02545 [Candidatus Bathyarchaeia archaeon]|jgi:hypothetical protein
MSSDSSTQPKYDEPKSTGTEESPPDLSETIPENKPPQKLEIDRAQDFKFHVAYGVYARAWEDNKSDTARLRLNELISSLSKDDSEDSYYAFYSGIQEYRRDSMSFRSGRTRIQTSRKRDWQQRDSRDRRDSRHR